MLILRRLASERSIAFSFADTFISMRFDRTSGLLLPGFRLTVFGFTRLALRAGSAFGPAFGCRFFLAFGAARGGSFFGLGIASRLLPYLFCHSCADMTRLAFGAANGGTSGLNSGFASITLKLLLTNQVHIPYPVR